jgi:hypothetical protein
MTVLRKALQRELPFPFDRRQWVVEMFSWGLEFRAKRTRKRFSITWESVLMRTMELEAAKVFAERHAKKRRIA